MKFITTYFDAHPTPPDEQLLDAMGIALAQADAAGVVKSSLFTDSGKTYKKLNAKLEATRTGEKRWGPRLAACRGCGHQAVDGEHLAVER